MAPKCSGRFCTLSEFQREVPHSIQVKTLQVCFPCGPELVEVSGPLSGGVKLLCLPMLVGNTSIFRMWFPPTLISDLVFF